MEGLRRRSVRLYFRMPVPTGKKWTSERVATVVRLCGALIAAFGLLWALYIAWFILRAEVAEGVLLRWDAVRSNSRESNGFTKTHTAWHAEMQFTDASGVPREARSPRGHNAPLWLVGQPLLLYYDPSNPEDILISHNRSIWFPPAAILGLGLLLFIPSSLAIRLLRRAARRNAAEVANIVAKHIAKKPALPPEEEAPSAITILDTGVRYVPFTAPSGKTFTHLPWLDSTDLDPALVRAFQSQDSEVLMLVAVDAFADRRSECVSRFTRQGVWPGADVSGTQFQRSAKPSRIFHLRSLERGDPELVSRQGPSGCQHAGRSSDSPGTWP